MTHPTTYTTTIQRKSRRWLRSGKGPMMLDEPTITAGEARAGLAHVRTVDPEDRSYVSPQLTRAHAADIVERVLPFEDDEPILPILAAHVLRLVLRRKTAPK